MNAVPLARLLLLLAYPVFAHLASLREDGTFAALCTAVLPADAELACIACTAAGSSGMRLISGGRPARRIVTGTCSTPGPKHRASGPETISPISGNQCSS